MREMKGNRKKGFGGNESEGCEGVQQRINGRATKEEL
jgi:hypothetical protein